MCACHNIKCLWVATAVGQKKNIYNNSFIAPMPPKVALSAAARTLGPGTRIGSRKQITNATYLRLVRLSRAKGPTKKKKRANVKQTKR